MIDTRSIVERLDGIIPFVPTPFREADDGLLTCVDEEGLRNNVRFLAKHHFKTICPCAGTGELFTLSDTEYRLVLRATVEEVGNHFLVLPGIPPETERAISAAQYAQELGCKCVLSFPPPALGVSEEGMYQHWRAIANSIDIGVVVFRAPWLPFSLDLLERLVQIPNVIAVKEETNDLGWYQKAERQMNGKVLFIGGGELHLPHYLVLGVWGITTGLPNFMPEPFLEMYSAAKNNDFARTIALHRKLRPLLELRQKPGNAIPLLKRGMDLVGLCGGVNRLPQVPLSHEDERLLVKYLSELGVI